MKFDISKLATGKVAETLMMSGLQTLKGLTNTVVNAVRDRFMFTMTIKENSEVYFAFQEWFYQNYEEKFKSVTVFNVAKNSEGKRLKGQSSPNHRAYHDNSFSFGVGYSQNSGTYMIKYEGAYIQVTKGIVEGDKSVGEKSVQFYTLSSTNKEKTKKLIEDVYDIYNQDQDQIQIFVSNLYGEWTLVKRIAGKTLDNIILNNDLHNRLVTDLADFEGDKEWYDSLNIPYKRGYLLYGPPGNGKTSLSIAIASEHKRNIYCLDVNKLRDDGALRTAFSQLQSNSLLLIEDVDVAFHMSREMDIKKKSFVTFGCLLNCLDGVYYKEGLVTIMTTNHIERLDPALIRPGRMDMKIHIPNPGRTEVEAYFTRFYNVETVLEGYDKVIPMAAVQGMCITHKNDRDKAIEELLSFDDTLIVQTYVTPAVTEPDGPDSDEEDYLTDDEEAALIRLMEGQTD